MFSKESIEKMKLPLSSQEKVRSAMRSLFRFKEFKSMTSTPDFILEQEIKILENRIKNLNPDELLYMVSEWSEYNKSQVVESEQQSIEIFNLIEEEMKSLN